MTAYKQQIKTLNFLRFNQSLVFPVLTHEIFILYSENCIPEEEWKICLRCNKNDTIK